MCREGAWAELTVQVTSMGVIRSRTHGFKIINRTIRIRLIQCYLGIRRSLLPEASPGSYRPARPMSKRHCAQARSDAWPPSGAFIVKSGLKSGAFYYMIRDRVSIKKPARRRYSFGIGYESRVSERMGLR